MSTPVVPISPTEQDTGAFDATPSSARLAALQRVQARVFEALKPVIGLVICCLIVADSITNNWSLNDYTGNAYHFRTPVLSVATVNDVRAQYNFPLRSVSISPAGIWMSFFNVLQLATGDPDMYLLTAGSYTVNKAILDKQSLCTEMANQYTLQATTSLSAVKIGASMDYMTYLQGNIFSSYDTSTLPHNMSGAALTSLGFLPGRLATDLRLSSAFNVTPDVPYSSVNVSLYRIYSKSFCSGCTPLAELGLLECKLTYSYNSTSRALVVHSSNGILGSTQDVGVLLQKSSFVSAAVYIKILSLLWVIVSFGASRKTTRWIEVETWFTLPWYSKLWYTVAPPIFRYASSAVSLSTFYYNCDGFVLGYSIAVMLDMNASLVYAREVNIYNSLSPNSFMSLQLYSMGLRFLWANCLVLKGLKIAFHYLSNAQTTGDNKMVRFCNLSSVLFIYLSGVALLNVNQLIEMNNKARIDVPIYNLQRINVHLDVFDSWFVRALPTVFAIGLMNLVFVLALNHLFMRSWWRRLERNTLARQFIYNSSAILVEFFDEKDFKPVDTDVKAIAPLVVPARSLCTLQWLLTCHLIRFGLTESPSVVKAIVTRTASKQSGDLFMVVQDSDGNVRLYDAHKAEVQSLGMEVKILNNTNYIIA
ncbi:hypothetical protein SDRG_13967 [Saprolegnia diclina VS20]|uniref:Uncharacterized protein n=1 Tax=Saprolegnia diclina (strain VS20) TaxID=1156394 RepID=T0Q2P2_SAPDV|nr:hypothetical protein SDRG_13967 [Saprolegnia diclina VS20]XP_008618943.1 hypothetical protein SDRG_14583 [Saprolegnia diclina VS20]EQC27675.1 hypothetical protein SDRG_14583 [Saprolegnia diclina VS20]EQC28286.1 hypothetical protein SDRG_13967 [Saprolegnia diclina VS20]|eukprot:XP_008618290.1 hypothetical protein SDRG_13967 [Saprolegnia diclina VS20]